MKLLHYRVAAFALVLTPHVSAVKPLTSEQEEPQTVGGSCVSMATPGPISCPDSSVWNSEETGRPFAVIMLLKGLSDLSNLTFHRVISFISHRPVSFRTTEAKTKAHTDVLNQQIQK